jgi:sugar phosphate isomerase/epimerase
MVGQLNELADWLIEGGRDLEIQDACVPEVLDGDWHALVRQARDTLGTYTGRMGIHGPFDGLTILTRDAKVRELAQARLTQGLEFAAELGATHMVVHSPFQFFGSPFIPNHPAYPRVELVQAAHEALDPLVQLAQQHHIMLVIENIFDTNPVLLVDLLRSFNSEYVRSSIDTGHAFINQRVGGPTPDQWIREMGEMLQHMHIQDTDGHTDRHWAPGDGNLNWYALFEALSALKQSPRLVIETTSPQKVKRGAAYFARCGFAV